MCWGKGGAEIERVANQWLVQPVRPIEIFRMAYLSGGEVVVHTFNPAPERQRQTGQSKLQDNQGYKTPNPVQTKRKK